MKSFMEEYGIVVVVAVVIVALILIAILFKKYGGQSMIDILNGFLTQAKNGASDVKGSTLSNNATMS